MRIVYDEVQILEANSGGSVRTMSVTNATECDWRHHSWIVVLGDGEEGRKSKIGIGEAAGEAI